MRYVPGNDLKAVLRREKALEPARAVAIAGQVAGALDAAHRARPRAPRREAEQRAARPPGRSRALLPRRLRPHPEHVRGRGRRTASSWAASTTSHPSRCAATRSTGAPTSTASPACSSSASRGPSRSGSRSDVAAIFAHLEEPPPSASERRAELPRAIDAVLARGMAKDPEERFESCGALVTAASRGARRGDAAVPAPTAGAASSRRPSSRSPGSRSRFVSAGGDSAARPPAPAAIVRVDPAHQRGHRARPRSAAIRAQLVVDARRALDGRLPRRRPVALRARRGPVERITSNGEPRDLAAVGRQGVRGRRRPLPLGRRLALRRRDRRARGRDRPAGVRDGRRAGSRVGGRLPVRAATEHGRRAAAEAASRSTCRTPTAGEVENSRVQFRELAVGAGSVWVLGDALDRRLWRLDARSGEIQATVELGVPADVGGRTPRESSGSPTGCTTGSYRSTPTGSGCSRRSRWAAGRAGWRPGTARCGS